MPMLESISADVLVDIMAELHRARTKFPTWPKGDIMLSTGIVCEESGEAIRAAVQLCGGEGGSVEAIRKEVVQTAVTCIRWLEGK